MVYFLKSDVKATAQVLDISFDNLPKERAEDTQNALSGYAYFAKVFEESKKQGKTRYEAYNIAVEKSLEKGYLADIWSREECVDMFVETYTYEDQLREDSWEEGREEGLEKGVEKGKIELYFTELNLSVKQIAEKMKLGEDYVNEVINKLGLA